MRRPVIPMSSNKGLVSRITAIPMHLTLANPLATSKRTYGTLDFIIVRAECGNSVTGWGEARECTHITGETLPGMLDAVNVHLGPAVMGLEPGDLDQAHQRMNATMTNNTAAKSAIDMALHDLAGHLAGLPVSRLLGGGPRGPIASSKAVSIGTTEAMVAQARDFVAAGFKTLKLKTGLDEEAELAAIGAIREAVGPDINLKLDANQSWSLHQATRFLAAVERCDIQMVEQPLAAWDFTGHAELRRRTPIPVMLDEGVHGPRDAQRAIEKGAADMVNIKLIKTGGLAPARDLTAICEAAGIDCQIGTLDTSIGSAAAAHLVHACPAIRYAEINGPTRLARDLATGLQVQDGHVILQEGPGLGIEIDRPAIEENSP